MNPLERLLPKTDSPVSNGNAPLSLMDRIRYVVSYVNQNGGNAEQLARAMAKEKGFNLDQVLEQAKSQEKEVSQFFRMFKR